MSRWRLGWGSCGGLWSRISSSCPAGGKPVGGIMGDVREMLRDWLHTHASTHAHTLDPKHLLPNFCTHSNAFLIPLVLPNSLSILDITYCLSTLYTHVLSTPNLSLIPSISTPRHSQPTITSHPPTHPPTPSHRPPLSHPPTASSHRPPLTPSHRPWRRDRSFHPCRGRAAPHTGSPSHSGCLSWSHTRAVRRRRRRRKGERRRKKKKSH